jgi:hypothetical protein
VVRSFNNSEGAHNDLYYNNDAKFPSLKEYCDKEFARTGTRPFLACVPSKENGAPVSSGG